MDQRPLRGGMKAVVTTVVALVFSVTTTSDGADGKPTRSMGVICSVDADGNPELQVHDAHTMRPAMCSLTDDGFESTPLGDISLSVDISLSLWLRVSVSA